MKKEQRINVAVKKSTHEEITKICDELGVFLIKLTEKLLKKFIKDYRKDPAAYLKLLQDKDLM